MIATFDVSVLKGILSKVERVAVSTNTMPILQCVKIIVDDGVEFVATSAKMGIRINGSCDVEETGEVLVNAKRLASLIRQLSDGEIKFSTLANDRLMMEVGGSTFKLVCYDVEEYPHVPVFSASDVIISGEELHRLLDGTVWAAGTEDRGLFLGGVFFDLTKMCTIGTDRAVFSSHWLDMDGTDGQAIIDKSFISTISSAFSDDDDVAIGVRDGQIVFSAPGITLTARLIEGKFPDFGPVFEQVKDNSVTVTVSRSDLIGVLRRALIFSTVADSIPRVDFVLGENLTIRSEGLMGASEECLEADIEGSIELAFNGQFVLNALNHYTSEKVIFKFDQPETHFSMEECDGVAGMCICMPLRLK